MDSFLQPVTEFTRTAAFVQWAVLLDYGANGNDRLLAGGTKQAPYTPALDTAWRENQIEGAVAELSCVACKEPHGACERAAYTIISRQPIGFSHRGVLVFIKMIIDGPSSTIQIEGKISNTIGIIILTGACCAFSWARWRRFTRI